MKRGIRIALSLMATIALPGAAGAGDAECPIFPVPKEYRAKDDKPVIMAPRVAVVIGEKAGEPEKFAASRLAYILKKRFSLKVRVLTAKRAPKRASTLLVLGTLESNAMLKSLKEKHAVGLDAFKGKDPMQDAFAIESVKEGKRQVVLMIGTTSRSVIYAQYAFLEAVRRDGVRVVHPNLSVRDWAGLRYRDWWPGNPDYMVTTVDALSQVTYARPNITQFRTFKSAEVSEDLVKECWKHGMKPYGTINGAIRRDGHAYAEQETRSWLKKGCYGIYVSFDDFGMGEDPEALCGKVTDIIKEHFGKVGDHIAVIAGADYDYLNSANNKRMAKFKDFEEAIFYITGPPHGVFSTKRHYDDAKAVGIKNYIWWHNFAMGSKGFYAPVRARRYFAQLRFDQRPHCWGLFTFDDLRKGAEHMTGYCAQNDGFDIAATQLFWAWDPVHYDFDRARRAVYRQRHGEAAVDAVQKLDDNMYRLPEYYMIMWRKYAMTEWCLKDPSKRKEVLALIDQMDKQFQAIKDGKPVSYLSDEGYDEHFIKPLEMHLGAARKLASLDFPDYAVQKREGVCTKGGPDLLKAWNAWSLQTKMVNLLWTGKRDEAEAYLADLRKEALPGLEVLEKELEDLWYTQEYVDGWRSMLGMDHWDRVTAERYKKQLWVKIARNAEGLMVLESSARDREILFTLDGPRPEAGAAEVYSGPRSVPGSHVVRAVLRQKGSGATSHVFVQHLGYPKNGWKVTYTDSDNGKDALGANVIDGNLDTVWFSDRTKDKPAHPHEIQIDLGGELGISSLAIYPRRNNGRGVPRRYEVYASADGKTWGDPVAAGEFGRIEKRMTINLKERTKARFVRLVFLSDFRSLHFSAVAEVDVYGGVSVHR